MPTYPRIKLISDTIDKGEITVRESDLMLPDPSSSPIVDVKHRTLIEIRKQGNLEGRALYINAQSAEPKIVTDSQGLTCLIFIRRHYD